MPNEQHSGNGQGRLDRSEGLMGLLIEDHVKFQEEHKLLLTAQVVLTDRLDRLAKTVKDLAEAQKSTEERLNALINIVDDIVPKRPPQ